MTLIEPYSEEELKDPKLAIERRMLDAKSGSDGREEWELRLAELMPKVQEGWSGFRSLKDRGRLELQWWGLGN
jgi:hypothetical protein